MAASIRSSDALLKRFLDDSELKQDHTTFLKSVCDINWHSTDVLKDVILAEALLDKPIALLYLARLEITREQIIKPILLYATILLIPLSSAEMEKQYSLSKDSLRKIREEARDYLVSKRDDPFAAWVLQQINAANYPVFLRYSRPADIQDDTNNLDSRLGTSVSDIILQLLTISSDAQAKELQARYITSFIAIFQDRPEIDPESQFAKFLSRHYPSAVKSIERKREDALSITNRGNRSFDLPAEEAKTLNASIPDEKAKTIDVVYARFFSSSSSSPPKNDGLGRVTLSMSSDELP